MTLPIDLSTDGCLRSIDWALYTVVLDLLYSLPPSPALSIPVNECMRDYERNGGSENPIRQ